MSFNDSEIQTVEIPSESIPRSAIERIIREIAGDYHFEKEAIDLLHQASEEYLVELFKILDACSKNAGRKTINKDDFSLIQNINN